MTKSHDRGRQGGGAHSYETQSSFVVYETHPDPDPSHRHCTTLISFGHIRWCCLLRSRPYSPRCVAYSGAQKLQSFNATTGGPVMDLMGPKMDGFLAHIKDLAHVELPLEKVTTVHDCVQMLAWRFG